MREVKPTQKPVPSSDIKDLFFNSGLLDIWATSLERKYIDRFGNCHLTAAGMEWLFNELVDKFKVDMNIAIVAAGYITIDSFQQGADLPNNELTQRNQILRDETTGEYFRWDGDLPKQVLAGSTPQSTGGIDKGAWISVGDASLRSELVNIKNIYKKYGVIPEYDFPDVTFTEALQLALNTKLPVLLLKDRYELDAKVNIPNSGVILGRGKTKTIIECITSTAGFYNDYGFNIQLKGFQLNGGNVANKGIVLGSQSGISAHHILDDIQVYDFKEANIHIIKGIYHHLTDGVYVTGGVGYGLLTESMDVSIIEGRYYNHAKGSVVITNSSNFNTFKGKVYNDIAFPSDYLMIVDSSCGNNIGFDFEPQGENNVKSSLIIDNVTGVPWKKSNMADNVISGNFLGLSKTSLEAHIVIGGNNAAYKTIIDTCKFLTLQNDLPDIKLVKQNDTKIINCVNNLTYDTPILKDAVVMNVGGDNYIHVKFKDEAAGSFNPIVKTTGTQPTITSTGDSAGYYQRIGNRCFVDLWVTISTTNNGTGAVQIHGLPFKQKSAGQRRASLCVSNHTVSDSGGYVAEGENYIDLIKGSGALVSTDLGSSFRFRASFSYLV